MNTPPQLIKTCYNISYMPLYDPKAPKHRNITGIELTILQHLHIREQIRVGYIRDTCLVLRCNNVVLK